MNPMKVVFFVACLAAAAMASPSHKHFGRGNSLKKASMKPSEWLSYSELEQLPALDKIDIKKLEDMSEKEGAELINKIYHVSQINHEMRPSYAPPESSIPCYILKANAENISVPLSGLAAAAKDEQEKCNNGSEELTILVTGVSDESTEVKKAQHEFVEAYMEHYNLELQQQLRQERNKLRKQSNKKYNDYDDDEDNDDEDDRRGKSYKSLQHKKECAKTGTLIIIDLADNLDTMERVVKLDTEETGNMIGEVIAEIKRKGDYHNVHLIGQNIGASVVGAACRKYTRITGRKIRRATGLDPSKDYTKEPETVVGLARGDADFVDAIHTSAYGMGTTARVGDIDFYPNGPSVGVPGSDNVVEASMRATRYFAESVRPGNEHNFPAVAATSLKDYETNNGHGKLTFMGIAADFDLEGDYIVPVAAQSPFGKSQPATRQTYQINQEGKSWSTGKNGGF